MSNNRRNIVSYKKKYKADFEKLNREWIEEFFQMEDEDFYTLQNPESYVIEKNGEIFFALYDQKVIGTAAMIPIATPTAIHTGSLVAAKTAAPIALPTPIQFPPLSGFLNFLFILNKHQKNFICLSFLCKQNTSL